MRNFRIALLSFIGSLLVVTLSQKAIELREEQVLLQSFFEARR